MKTQRFLLLWAIYLMAISLLAYSPALAQIPVNKYFSVPDGYRRLPVPTISFASYVRHNTQVKDGLRAWLSTNKPLQGQTNHAALIDFGNLRLPADFDCADYVVYQAVRYQEEYLKDNLALFLERQQRLLVEVIDSVNPIIDPLCGYETVELYKLASTHNYFSSAQGRLLTYWEYLDYCTTGNCQIMDYTRYLYKQTNTTTLMQDVVSIPLADIQPGDVFLTPKTATITGHVCMVMDVAINDQTGDKVFLIGQGMPSQTPHILNNPLGKISPVWYSLSEITAGLRTPSFIYSNPAQALKRFKAVVPFVKEL